MCYVVIDHYVLYEAVVIDHYVLYLKKIDGTDILMVLLLHYLMLMIFHNFDAYKMLADHGF